MLQTRESYIISTLEHLLAVMKGEKSFEVAPEFNDTDDVKSLFRNKANHLSPYGVEVIKGMFARGMGDAEIAREMGITLQAVSSRRKR